MKTSAALLAFAALAVLAAAPAAFADSAPVQIHGWASGPGLVLASPATGGLFAAGAVETFRVLNASPQSSLDGISARATGSAGFKVVSNACPAVLAPKSTCLISVRWTPVGSSARASGTLRVHSGSVEVESALSGDAALRP